MYDLVIKSARLIDPANNHDQISDIAIENGRVAAIESSIATENAQSIQDASGLIAVPGLIDLHTHVYWAGTSIGVEPTAYARQAGTTIGSQNGLLTPNPSHGQLM